MTQRHISHPEPLPPCAAGHNARKVMPAITAPGADNIVQLDFGTALSTPARRKAAGGAHGRR